MSKKQMNKRFKHLLDNESRVTARECAIAKRSAKLGNRINIVRQVVEKHCNQLDVKKVRVEKMRHEIEILSKFKEAELVRQHELELSVADLTAQIAEHNAECATQRKVEMELRESLRTLKKTTNTYLNYDFLLERTQGISIYEKEKSSKWQPISIDPVFLDRKEMKRIIREQSKNAELNQEWERLCFC